MEVGFTATRRKITPVQRARLKEFLKLLLQSSDDSLHHGDCVNGDETGQQVAAELNVGCNVHIHPPTDPKLRAYCEPVGTGCIWKPEPYITRNHVIVDVTDCLVACPGDEEFAQPRSGTWATVRYAKKQNGDRQRLGLTPKLIAIIYPDGHTKDATDDDV